MITKEGFYGKTKKQKQSSNNNMGFNLELELQDKKIMNKLILIQKHNEGLLDLPQINQSNTTANNSRINNKHRQSSVVSPKNQNN